MSHLNKVIFLIVFALTSQLGFSQHDPNLLGDAASGYYVIYKVRAKENFFSIGKQYDIRYQDIIDFNNLGSSSLSVGQELKIPIKKENFINQDVEISNEFLPLIHKVKAKEGLFRIGVAYFKTPIQLLMKWNGLTDYNLKVNQKLIVGYVKSKDATLQYIGSPDKFAGQPYIPPVRDASSGLSASVVDNNKNLNQPLPQSTPRSTLPAAPNKSLAKGGQGEFEVDFKNNWSEGIKGQKSKKLQTNLFTSNTGWNDSKYYAMSSEIPSTSFVKITNPANQKIIFVKVLGDLPAKYKDKGVQLIISSAGATQLDMTDPNKSYELDCVF